MSQDNLESIISRFSIPGTLVKTDPFGTGLINDTYLALFDTESGQRKYILQRINPSVFRNPLQVMENVEIVTAHIVNKLRLQGVSDPFLVTPALIHTRDNTSSCRDETGNYWRVFHFIEAGIVHDRVIDRNHAYETGRGVGRFQAQVSDLLPTRLHDTLPGFHHTPHYLREYDAALSLDVAGRSSVAGAEMKFISSRRKLAPVLTDLMASGELPLRVVHNDPKVDNVMIHHATHEAICMIDLDTVKPGIVHFDFGDVARSAANPTGEDAPDLNRVHFDLSLFEAVAAGYLREASAFLIDQELAMLPISVQVITFELGLRFLADYLRGDTYFRIRYPAHNLHRARVQFKLLEKIEAAEDKMAALINRC